jgi:hypothetical protein
VPPDERLRVRNERSRPLLAALETWPRERRAKLSGQSKTGKAIAYSHPRWAALSRLFYDGRLRMTNNAAERQTRAVALGRKNWTFAGCDEGGRRAAANVHADPDRQSQRRRPRKLGSQMSSRACRIIQSKDRRTCPGTGSATRSNSKRLRSCPGHNHRTEPTTVSATFPGCVRSIRAFYSVVAVLLGSSCKPSSEISLENDALH